MKLTRLLRRGCALAAAAAALGGPAHAAEVRNFDYWLLTLSWSPEYCAQKPSDKHCKQSLMDHQFRGFVVSELAPMLNAGRAPPCDKPSESVPDEMVLRMREMMPSVSSVKRQWKQHGGCTGATADEHFLFVERVFRKVEIPAPYRAPDSYLDTTEALIKQNFTDSNPGFPPDSFSLACASNRHLSEVRVCLDNELQPRSCGREIKGRCPEGRISLRPVR